MTSATETTSSPSSRLGGSWQAGVSDLLNHAVGQVQTGFSLSLQLISGAWGLWPHCYRASRKVLRWVKTGLLLLVKRKRLSFRTTLAQSPA